jgi:hypothetical protein
MITVDALTDQFRTTSRLLVAAEANAKTLERVEALTAALAPFRDMALAEFTELLLASHEFRRTGQWPPPPAKKSGRGGSKSKINAGQAVEHYTTQLVNLYDVIEDDAVGVGAIDDLMGEIGGQSAAVVKAIAAGFGLSLPAKITKPKALAEIRGKLEQRKANAVAAAPIHSGSM